MTVHAGRSHSQALRRLAVGVASGLCVLAFPLALVGANLRAVALDERFYLAEFERYAIGAQNNFSSAELRIIANAFIDYFQSPPGRMNLQLTRNGVIQPLFNERELAHMEDVQALIQGIFWLQEVAIAYVAAYVVGGILLGRGSFLWLLGRVMVTVAGLIVVVFVVLGALALTTFSELFLQFHLVSFANDLWLLDPRRDYLIRLFPQEFFLDAALRIAALTIVEALGLGAIGLLALYLARRRTGLGPA